MRIPHSKTYDKARDWLEAADTTYLSSRTLYRSQYLFLWFEAAYLLHQSIEKYLKALLLSKGMKKTGHNLDSLVKTAEKIIPTFDIARDVAVLNKFEAFRYPDVKTEAEGSGDEEFSVGDKVVKAIRCSIPERFSKGSMTMRLVLRMADGPVDLTALLLEKNCEKTYWESEIGLGAKR